MKTYLLSPIELGGTMCNKNVPQSEENIPDITYRLGRTMCNKTDLQSDENISVVTY